MDKTYYLCYYIVDSDNNCIIKNTFDKYNLCIQEHTECDKFFNIEDCNECYYHNIHKLNLIKEFIDIFDFIHIKIPKFYYDSIYDISESNKRHPYYKICKFNKLDIAKKFKELSYRLIKETQKDYNQQRIDELFNAFDVYKGIYNKLDNNKYVYIFVYSE